MNCFIDIDQDNTLYSPFVNYLIYFRIRFFNEVIA
uniref:Uncharacterized protein n=1 Tax=Ascaris lumbricoides TaxID=6252 RepID=A0A0M3HLT8_ASCLU